MSLLTLLGLITFILFFVALILFVLFGQVTVRKLRKNPATKDQLGVEFASGWDIFNVAQAMTIPAWLNKKFMESPLAFMEADSELLKKHTNVFDRLLARFVYISFIVTTLSFLTLTALEALGVFD